MQSRIMENVPVHYLRFEDLVREPRETLTDLFKYLLGAESLEGTVAEHRIN